MSFHLETPRLILRPFRESDLDTFLAYRNDPEVAKYQGWDIPYPREKAYEFISLMGMSDPNGHGEWYQVAVELKSSGELIGDVAFCTLVHDEKQALMGYSLASPYWRKGYAFEAIGRLLEYLFEERCLHRVVAECDVENVASWNLLEKLGFRREAYLVENILFKGSYGSEYHYALLEREWRKRP